MTENQDAGAEAAPVPARNVLAYPGYVKLLAASFLGALADRFYQSLLLATANVIFLPKIAIKEVGRVQIYSLVPMLILYGFSGALVDGFNRRKLLSWIEGLKAVLVLGFVALLWSVVARGENVASATAPAVWRWCFVLLIVLSIITVPFGPARAAVVPDVLPEERRSMGASLIATAGLFSYLVGSTIGMPLANPTMLGPVLMAVLASGIYLLSTFLFSRLPAEAAVPGNQRKGDDPALIEAPKKMSAREYAVELWHGVYHCFERPALLALIFFESIFWTIASMMLMLIFFYATSVLGLKQGDVNTFSGIALGAAGLGLASGALGAGKLCRVVSPVFNYFPAFIFVIVGFYGVFAGEAVRAAAAGTYSEHASPAFFPLLILLALGGGMMLGRVDADVLSIADERFRGRIFAIKAVVFAACTLGTLIWITEGTTSEQKFALMLIVPRISLWILPLVFVFAWMVDTAIWKNFTDIAAPNLRMRIQFRICSFITLVWIKMNFRYTTIGTENVPKSGGVILAANHGSFIDPFFLGSGCPRMVQFMMYSSYYKSFMHPIFPWLSAIPIDEKKNLQALKTGVQSLEKGMCIGIFPEGLVAYEKKLYPPQGGALFLAQKSGAPIVPVALKGNWDALPRGAIFPRFKKVTAIYGKPFVVGKNLSKQEVADLTRKMMETIASMLDVPPPEIPAPEKAAEKQE